MSPFSFSPPPPFFSSPRSLHIKGTLAFYALLFTISCTPPKEEEPPPKEEEPSCQTDLNYDAATAENIELNAVIDGFLCPARDADLYRFTVENDGSVVFITLRMDTFLSPIEPTYSILNDDGTPTGITGKHPNRSSGEAVNFTLAHGLNAGSYLVRIADLEGFDANFDITNPYELLVDVQPNPDANEPNENADAATPITINTPTTGLIGTTGDEDWFAIPVESTAQIIDVTLTAPASSGVDHILEVYDESGTALLDSRPLRAAPQDEALMQARIRVPASGSAGTSYFIRIYDEGGDNASLDDTLFFTLTANVFTNPDLNEGASGNDNYQSYTEVAAGASVIGVLATRGDQDVYIVKPGVVTTPKVLVFDLVFQNLEEELQPQVRIFSLNPERGETAAPACNADCLTCVAGLQAQCGNIRLQRLLDQNTYRGAIAVRNSDWLQIVVNELFDDQFQEAGDYTLSIQLIDDPDPRADDYLLSVQDSGGGNNDAEIRNQFRQSAPRATNITAGNLVESCEYPPPPDAGMPDAGVAPAPQCLPTIAVPAPGPGGQVGYTVDCNGESFTSVARGRLTYEGDRDLFRIDLPEAGYWALNTSYTVSTNTPVELTVFFRAGDSGELISSFLEAQQVGSCQSSIECPDGAVCIDRTCWQDTDSNPAINSGSFPNAGQCSYVHVNNSRPLYLEITDNGINDFDLDMEYTVTVTASCGCPAECNGGFEACQGVAPPN